MLTTAPFLDVVRQCGEGALVLAEHLTQEELLRSRLTRGEIERLLLLMARTLAAVPPEVKQAMPEIDWAAWQATERQLLQGGDACDEALWFAVRSLVTATLSWLRLYRRSQPALFDYRP